MLKALRKLLNIVIKHYFGKKTKSKNLRLHFWRIFNDIFAAFFYKQTI